MSDLIQRKTLNQLIDEALIKGKSHDHYSTGMISVVKMHGKGLSKKGQWVSFWSNGNHSITEAKARKLIQEHFDIQQLATSTEKVTTMQQVTFFFHPQRESDENNALWLARKHFPGAFKLGHSESQIRNRGVLIKCTGEQFVAWVVERCNMGFVNRMKQLEMRIEYKSFGSSERVSSRPEQYVAVPIQYSTPEAEGLR